MRLPPLPGLRVRARGAGFDRAEARADPGARRAALGRRGSPGTPPLPVSQGPAEWREGEAQAAGPAGHGAAPQAVAAQAPRQSVPHQDGEDSPGARLADDASAGVKLVC